MNYHVLKPTPLTLLTMDSTSSKLYEIYYSLLKTHTHKKAVELTKQYVKDHPPQTIDDEIAYSEFLYMNNCLPELKDMLDSNRFNPDVSLLYGALVDRVTQKFSKKTLEWLQSQKFTHPSLHCLHIFTIVYSYYDMKSYTGLDKYLDDCYQAVHYVNEPLVLYYMNLRFNELLFQHYWKTNNTILAKKYAYKIINSELSSKKRSTMHHNLALCYVFEGFDSSIEQARIALTIAKENNDPDAITSLEKHTIPFLSAFHEETQNISTPDPVETAHIAIANNDFQTAITILLSIDHLTPFQECYLGYATGNKEMLRHSNQRFIIENGDHFFAQLPLYYLDRL